VQPAPNGWTLFTTGYQGHTIETFLDLLLAHGIAHVIDVRQLPFSRKPDFSKKRLTAHLAAVGIAYTHLVELGTPKPLRDEVRRMIESNGAAGIAAAQRAMAARPDAAGQLAGIAVPALVVGAGQDPIIPLEETRAMQAAIPGSRLLELRSSGHLSNLEAPEAFSAALADFLSSAETERGSR